MPEIDKVPDRVYLVVATIKYENGAVNNKFGFYEKLGSARGMMTRIRKEYESYKSYSKYKVETSIILYEAPLKWEPHADTREYAYDFMLKQLERETNEIS